MPGLCEGSRDLLAGIEGRELWGSWEGDRVWKDKVEGEKSPTSQCEQPRAASCQSGAWGPEGRLAERPGQGDCLWGAIAKSVVMDLGKGHCWSVRPAAGKKGWPWSGGEQNKLESGNSTVCLPLHLAPGAFWEQCFTALWQISYNGLWASTDLELHGGGDSGKHSSGLARLILYRPLQPV